MTNTTKKKSLQNFFLKLAACLLIISLVDFTAGAILNKYYFNQQSGYDYLTTCAIENTTADILILGSSRAVNIYNTDIFAKQTKLSCFNAGRYGEPIFYHYAVLKAALKRYTPKTVILSFDAGNFSINAEAYDRIAALLPYYKRHPEIHSIVELKSPFEKMKLLSSIYPFNSLPLSIVAGNRESNKAKYSNSNGFIPIEKTFEGELKTFDYTKEKQLDPVKIEVYKSLMQECINRKVELVVICPPYQIHRIGVDASINEGKRLAQQNDIRFLDYSADTSFTNYPALFADFRHLNIRGVEKFSNVIIDTLKKRFQ
ncbi:MAG: esterase, hydrolase-type domain [Ferruginibacter sp.]|uniref:hypothetical protein n=1 Tax=Ferruginibacter sp. TaxID=1940288 RepID=UPI00265A2658|nr:hypothetical protein [Ferruginibacter sp.]MDB5277771.1 esterase, hydrolase-type domain [Ferruginibacter sp.]